MVINYAVCFIIAPSNMDKLTPDFKNFMNALSPKLVALNSLYADRLCGKDIKQSVDVFPRYRNGKNGVVELIYQIHVGITGDQQMVNAIAAVIEGVGRKYRYSVIARGDDLVSSNEPLSDDKSFPGSSEVIQRYGRSKN